MSIEFNEEDGGKILSIRLSGKLTKEDYEKFTPEVERLIQANGKLRIFCQMHDFHGWTMGALWQDMKFDWKHFADIERLALVGESKWEQGMATFCAPFTKAKIQYFDTSKAAEAAAWLRE